MSFIYGDQSIGGQAGQGLAPGVNAAVQYPAKRQNEVNIAGDQASLGLAGRTDLSSIDFSQLQDPRLQALYTARKNSILQERAAPGRTQTILANPLQRY